MTREEAREAAWEGIRCKGCETCMFEGDGSCDDYAEQWVKAGFDAGYTAAERATEERIAERLQVIYRDNGDLNRASSMGREVAALYRELIEPRIVAELEGAQQCRMK